MFTHRLMRAADETLLWNEQQNDFYHFYFFLLRHEPAGGSLGFESLSCFWFFFCQIPNLELCVVSLCFRHSLFFFLCCRFYCFVNNFPTTRPELLRLCVSFGGYFFFSFLFSSGVFFLPALSARTATKQIRNANKPNAGVYLSSCTQHTPATPILEIIVSLLHSGFIFTPFFLFLSLLLASKTNHKQLLSHAELDCCVLILQTDWLLKFRSLFILQCRCELISALVLFVVFVSSKQKTFQYKQENQPAGALQPLSILLKNHKLIKLFFILFLFQS